MTDIPTQFSKSIILRDLDVHKNLLDIPLTQGLGVTNRNTENGENYAILQGTKQQINKYCQDAGKHLLSERSRHFANLPKYRIIGNVKVRVQ